MKHRGFTLVELSIVLVIIGLIVGGVVGGQSLIKSAQINSTISDIGKYKTAITTFELQYDAKPGDMVDAQSYWPSCVDNSAFPKNTCNGDGNNRVQIHDGTDWIHEEWRAWQHLGLAKILPRDYSGIRDPVGNYF
jgi:prepilin-type N-terminal cleavage/methylation domain-containing protein